MCRGGKYKNGNPKRSSRFICCKCLKENFVGSGIQRANQREKGHTKDLFCICCGEITKNTEVRYCDSFNEMMEKAEEYARQEGFEVIGLAVATHNEVARTLYQRMQYEEANVLMRKPLS